MRFAAMCTRMYYYLSDHDFYRVTSSEGKSRVELALEGVYGCGCGQNFAPQYPAVIYKPNRKSPGASIRGVGCQRHQQWATRVRLGMLAALEALWALLGRHANYILVMSFVALPPRGLRWGAKPKT